MKRFDVPYKYYRCTLVGSWAFAILCIIGTWIAFQIGDHASVTFYLIVDIFLTLSLGTLTTLLFLSDRPNFRKKGIAALFATIGHLVFYIVISVLYFQGKIDGDETKPIIYLLPSFHTLILVAIVVLGIYFYSRGKYVFKNAMRKDAAVAFGGEVADEPSNTVTLPTSDEPKKPARDEKTGIVSL